MPLLWATRNPRKGDNVVSLPSLGQPFGETAGRLGENRKGKFYVPLDSVIGLFLVHRRLLPKAAMQAQDPNLPTAHPVLLPPHQGLEFLEKELRSKLWEGPAQETQAHTQSKPQAGASHLRPTTPNPRERTLLQHLKGTGSPDRALASGELELGASLPSVPMSGLCCHLVATSGNAPVPP